MNGHILVLAVILAIAGFVGCFYAVDDSWRSFEWTGYRYEWVTYTLVVYPYRLYGIILFVAAVVTGAIGCFVPPLSKSKDSLSIDYE